MRRWWAKEIKGAGGVVVRSGLLSERDITALCPGAGFPFFFLLKVALRRLLRLLLGLGQYLLCRLGALISSPAGSVTSPNAGLLHPAFW